MNGRLARTTEQGSRDSLVEFNPARYQDTVRARVLAAIQRKVDGQEIVAEAPAEQDSKIVDLMEALNASIARRGGAPPRAEGRGACQGRGAPPAGEAGGAELKAGPVLIAQGKSFSEV